MIKGNCPLCGALVSLQDRNCGSCGVDLAYASMLAADALSSNIPGVTSVAPEVLVPRVGEYYDIFQRKLKCQKK